VSILITGGTGFLGRYLARHLLQKGEGPLILVSRFPDPQAVPDIADQVKLVHCDCAEATELMRVVKTHDITEIFHMASYVGETEQLHSEAIRVNLIATHNVFEIAMLAGVRRVVWSSSAAMFPPTITSPSATVLDETVTPDPQGIYGAAKLFNEHVAEHYRRRYGFDHVVLRPTSVFGLGRAQRRGGGAGIYGDMVEALAAGRKYVVPPRDHKVMWAYVLDCAEAFYYAWKAENLQHRIFMFGGEVCTVGETIDFLGTLLPQMDVEYSHEGERIVSMVSDRLLQQETGYRPRYGMREGIKHYVDELPKTKRS